ncbi:MAG: hypothetical protein OJF59_001654 [Cytophagales bacterium]|jgi:tetratricopeptide (TPR) repeat protein|nr:tetratricopeptide repeat protein [Bacteroidota bacterium]WHZ07901.1 MAG: hypothetical protein OJF59_001654 [Cytophagales bacterium]
MNSSISKPEKCSFFFCLLLLCTLPVFCYAQQKLSKIQRWEARADTLMKQENFRSSAELYSKILSKSKKKDQKYYLILYKRTLSYYRSEKFELAVKDVNVYLEKNKDSQKAYLLRALINQQLGEEDKLLPDVTRAIELGHVNPQLLRWRATLLFEQGNFIHAKKEFLNLKNFTDDPELEINLALVYRSLNNADSAYICLTKAIELDPKFIGSYVTMASFCLDDENYEAALSYLNQALKIDPANGTILFYKGVALVELKQIDKGCSCLRKALDAGEEDAVDYLKEYCYDVYK